MRLVYQLGTVTCVALALAACSSPEYTKTGSPVVTGHPAYTMGSGSHVAASGEQATTHGIGGVSGFQGQSMGAGSGAAAASGGVTPALQSQIAALPKTIYFGFDQYHLDASAQKLAQINVAFLLKYPNVKVVLAGHTDPRGSQEYNFHLGERRANAVKNYFLQQGVNAQQLCTVSYGELKPATSPAAMAGNWQKAYKLDRRTVIEYGQTCKKGTA